jgi:hypothetical protein
MLADLRRRIQLSVVVTRPDKSQEQIGKLPSSLSRDMAMATLSSLNVTCLESPTKDEMVTLRVSRILKELSETNEEDKALYGLVFGFPE